MEIYAYIYAMFRWSWDIMTDAIQNMLQPIHSKIGEWVYALIWYDLVYKSFKFTKGQIIVGFTIEHRIYDMHDILILALSL